MLDTRQMTNQECEQALVLQTRMLLGETLDPQELELLAKHAAKCVPCQREFQQIEKAHAKLAISMTSTKLSGVFTSKTMAALPQKPVTEVEPPVVRVFAPAPQRKWPLVLSGIAAGVAAAVLVAWFAVFSKTDNVSGELVANKASLIGPDGRIVRHVKQGLVYKVKEDTVLPLQGNGLVKLQQGAEFTVTAAPEGAEPELVLQSGDVYAHGASDEKPIRINCNTFESLLQAGDFFVADEGGEEAAGGVVIVFNGNAQVRRQDEAVPLRSGQVFLSIGQGESQFVQVIELSEAITHIATAPQMTLPDAVSLRQEYEKRVHGYHRELETLKAMAQRESDAHRQAELKERAQRVSAYYEAHRRKLETLKYEMPLDLIKRGLNRRSDSSTWM